MPLIRSEWNSLAQVRQQKFVSLSVLGFRVIHFPHQSHVTWIVFLGTGGSIKYAAATHFFEQYFPPLFDWLRFIVKTLLQMAHSTSTIPPSHA